MRYRTSGSRRFRLKQTAGRQASQQHREFHPRQAQAHYPPGETAFLISPGRRQQQPRSEAQQIGRFAGGGSVNLSQHLVRRGEYLFGFTSLRRFNNLARRFFCAHGEQRQAGSEAEPCGILFFAAFYLGVEV